jgi:release factor glutamine methyltransferase
VSDERAALRAQLETAAARLAAAGVPSPRPDALALAAHALGVERLVLAVPPPVPDGFAARYRDLVARRAAREPLQHILGFTHFRRVRLRVEPGVFVPRPETELVAGAAIAAARVVAGRAPLVVDLCTGTGAIAAAVADELPGARVVAVDVEPAAAALARANLAGAPSARVRVGDVADPGLLAELDGTVDVVVSNPPYIPPDTEPVDPEVREHDPARALYGGGADGLGVPRLVSAAAARLLRPGGVLVMEHGDAQGAAARTLVAAAGAFAEIVTHPDLTGRDRFVTARRA